MINCYILDADHRPVKAELFEWADWMTDPDHRRVSFDQTRLFEVSTVFLGLDHNYSGNGPPILFETMVFEREAEIREIFGALMPIQPDVEQWRYASWDDALTGHKVTLRRLQKAEADALKTI